jgi:uncharacterized membrane protein YoaK (UPF0700 family)
MIIYLRRLTGKERSEKADRHLAQFLTFVAGAANAGGFLAVRQYTSHMSGIVSSMADNLSLGDIGLVLSGLGALLSFIAGAACSAVLVNWGRRQHLQSEYAFPLVLEAVLLICFGLVGGHLARQQWLFVPTTVMLLCFIMGLQNAIITKLSQARIRTTHITGLVTDMGIELGKLVYWNVSQDNPERPAVMADRRKLKLLASLVTLFFVGGVAGAMSFKHIGFAATLPLAVILLLLAAVPVLDDVFIGVKRLRKRA